MDFDPTSLFSLFCFLQATNVDPWDIVATSVPVASSTDPWQVQSSTTQQPQTNPIPPPQQQVTRRQSSSRGPRPPSGHMYPTPSPVGTASLIDTTAVPQHAVAPANDPWVPRARPPLQRRPSKADEWLDNMVAHSVVEAARRSASPAIHEGSPSPDPFQPIPSRGPQSLPSPTARDPFQPFPSHGVTALNNLDPFQPMTSQHIEVTVKSTPDPFLPMQTSPSRSLSADVKPTSGLSFDEAQSASFSEFYPSGLTNGPANRDTDEEDGGESPWKPMRSQQLHSRYDQDDDWDVVTSRHLRSQAFPDSREDQFS